MRGEYAKKGRRNYKVKQALSISSVCDETMALGIVSEVARMFSVDENSSSFFSFLHCCHARLIRGFLLNDLE